MGYMASCSCESTKKRLNGRGWDFGLIMNVTANIPTMSRCASPWTTAPRPTTHSSTQSQRATSWGASTRVSCREQTRPRALHSRHGARPYPGRRVSDQIRGARPPTMSPGHSSSITARALGERGGGAPLKTVTRALERALRALEASLAQQSQPGPTLGADAAAATAPQAAAATATDEEEDDYDEG